MPNISDIYGRHAHYLEQYYNGQADKLTPYLNRIAKALRMELTKTQTVRSQAKIERLLVFTENLVVNELTGFTNDLSSQIEEFSLNEAEFAVDSVNLQDDLFDITIPAQAQLNAAVNARPFNNILLKDYLTSFSKEQGRMVRDAVSMGFFEGKSTQEIVQGIIGTKSQNYKNGILNVTRTSGDRMVRTALSHTAAVTKNKVFEDNSDIVPYYEWLSTLDGRTSPICRGLDGKVFEVGKGRLPPAHFNCRSTTSPSFTKEPTDRVSYNDWLGKQSKAFQIDVLGKSRAELFRKGNIRMDQFVNNRGQVLTLDQLKTKYPSAWGKI